MYVRNRWVYTRIQYRRRHYSRSYESRTFGEGEDVVGDDYIFRTLAQAPLPGGYVQSHAMDASPS